MRKYGPEKTPNSDTFRVVLNFSNFLFFPEVPSIRRYSMERLDWSTFQEVRLFSDGFDEDEAIYESISKYNCVDNFPQNQFRDSFRISFDKCRNLVQNMKLISVKDLNILNWKSKVKRNKNKSVVANEKENVPVNVRQNYQCEARRLPNADERKEEEFNFKDVKTEIDAREMNQFEKASNFVLTDFIGWKV